MNYKVNLMLNATNLELDLLIKKYISYSKVTNKMLLMPLKSIISRCAMQLEIMSKTHQPFMNFVQYFIFI